MYDLQLAQAISRDNFTYHYPIVKQLFFVYFYRVFESIVIVMSCSYFCGVGWRIFTTIYIDYEKNKDIDVYNGQDTFYTYYDFVDEDGIHMQEPIQFSIYFYYAITTLSTVGYGDYSPKHTDEKLAIAIMLLLLISVYSYNMNILMEVLVDYKKLELGATQQNRYDL